MPALSTSPLAKLSSAGSVAPLPAWKRALDLACCCLALPALALGTLLISVLIAFVSPGPIFFRQERVGLRGRRFRLFKFRTMHMGAATSQHQAYFATLMATGAPMQKLDAKGDSRLIPGGWLIRATGLDELPQIINVLRGEMSVVGPRPCLAYEYENYTSAQRRRFRSVPGLTGLWQVSGKNQTSFGRMIRLDVYYSAKKSLWLDLKILGLTLPAIVRQVVQMMAARRKSNRQPLPAEALSDAPPTRLSARKGRVTTTP